MKIKDYKCKCGHNDFFFADKGNQKGIYCSYCGKWLKWADKDEQNLALKQGPLDNDYVSREKVKEILRSGVSLDLDEDKDYVCDLIDKLPSRK